MRLHKKSNTMKRVKINEDGFVWKVINRNEAIDVLNTGVFFLYALHDDDSESEITTIEEMDLHIRRGGLLGIEVGFIDDNNN